jgi:hypothetical protein
MSFTLLGILNSQAAGGGGASFEHLATFSPGTASSWSITGLGAYSDYKHLHIRATLEAQRREVLLVKFNNDSGSNYNRAGLMSASSNGDYPTSQQYYTVSGIELPEAMGRPGVTPSVMILDLIDFNSTTKPKILKGYFAQIFYDEVRRIFQGTGNWRSTSAITQIDFSIQGGWASTSNTTFAIYGVRA